MNEHHGHPHWAGRILAAIREHRLELYYQPIVPVGTGGPAGDFVELLLRMRDEEGTLVPPAAFLPAAERYDLLPAIDRWVVSTALASLAGRYPSGHGPRADLYSINLSGASLGDETFLAFVRARLAEHRVPPEVICFELTETVAITNLGVAVQFINELRALDCLRELGVDYAQGYAISRLRPLAERLATVGPTAPRVAAGTAPA
jgi:EAL domain-containing protein (putative c-di-GMP-specific phosphodiesterase class I)